MKKTSFMLFLSLHFCQFSNGQVLPIDTTEFDESIARMHWDWGFSTEMSQKEDLRAAYDLPPSDVDYEGFMELATQVYGYRKTRLVDLETFLEMSRDSHTIILDTRSKYDFDQIHLAGAVHINFSNFTVDKLAKVIPSQETRILIYCNNNFKGTPFYFPSKRKTLALNIPTFINLYGYGYQNIYELKDLLPFPTDLVKFEGQHWPKN